MKYSAVDENYFDFISVIEKNLKLFQKLITKKFKPRGPRFGVLWDLCKTHKRVLDKCSPFRPILLAVKTPSYNLAKFFSSPH